MLKDIDWVHASPIERKILYRGFKAILDANGISMLDALRQAYLGTAEAGKSDQEDPDNLKSGRASGKRYALIYKWICRHYPREAEEIAETYYLTQPQSVSWNAFLTEHGKFENISIPANLGLDIVKRAAGEPIADQKVPLGKEFYFEVGSPINGTVLALQEHKGAWYGLPLSNDDLHEQIQSGKQLIPNINNGSLPLIEEDKGKHRFVFIIADQDAVQRLGQKIKEETLIPNVVLDDIATILFHLKKEWHVFRINMLFVDGTAMV